MKLFLERLRSEPKKRVDLEVLQRHFYVIFPEMQASPERRKLLLEALQGLESEGLVGFPAKASWERLGEPALPKWVTVTPVNVVAREVRDFSAVPWVPELGFWPLLNPQQLTDLERINAFLLRRRGSIRDVPIKERSLEIFGDEKRLDILRKGDTLFSGQLPLVAVGAFPVPLPLPYRQADAPGRQVLIVENHNSFWSFGEWNHETKFYAAVVYGAGEAFRSTGAALGQVLREVEGVGAQYLGDLDIKGVRIPVEFNRSAREGSPKVAPALDWYAWLLANGTRRRKPECASSARSDADAWLGPELGTRVHDMWQSGQWIPQESLGYGQLADFGGTPI